MQGANYSGAKQQANRVLEENYVVEPPVRIDQIASTYGIEIYESDLEKDIAGLLDMDRRVIFVNKSDPPNRQTFTIAHELGHFIMHQEVLKTQPEYAIFYRKPLGKPNGDSIESEANCFAANLLVPKDMLDKYEDESINRKAEIFGVSADVIGYRMQYELKSSR